MARMAQKTASPAHPQTARPADPRLDPLFIERERNRLGARALGFLVLLNGAAALVLLAILGRAPESSVDSKVAIAMLFFSGGAIAALLSSFLAYINRTLALEAPERATLRRALQICAIVAVVGSAAAFFTGMNMVGDAASERSSSHPKGPKEAPALKEQSAPTAEPSERVELPTNASSPADIGVLRSEPGLGRGQA
jgi:hypothetical protein